MREQRYTLQFQLRRIRMKMLQALIVDDERYAREELAFLLEQYTDIQVISEVNRGEKAVLVAIDKEPDVVFLDIEMPKMNGIEIAQSLQKLKKIHQVRSEEHTSELQSRVH